MKEAIIKEELLNGAKIYQNAKLRDHKCISLYNRHFDDSNLAIGDINQRMEKYREQLDKLLRTKLACVSNESPAYIECIKTLFCLGSCQEGLDMLNSHFWHSVKKIIESGKSCKITDDWTP